MSPAELQGCLKKKKTKKVKTYLKKIIKENFLNLAKERDIQVQEEQRNPNKLDPKRDTLKHIIIKMPKLKDKERILNTKAEIEKQRLTQQGVPVRLSADLSKETSQAARGRQELSKMMKSKDLQPR